MTTLSTTSQKPDTSHPHQRLERRYAHIAGFCWFLKKVELTFLDFNFTAIKNLQVWEVDGYDIFFESLTYCKGVNIPEYALYALKKFNQEIWDINTRWK